MPTSIPEQLRPKTTNYAGVALFLVLYALSTLLMIAGLVLAGRLVWTMLVA